MAFSRPYSCEVSFQLGTFYSTSEENLQQCNLDLLFCTHHKRMILQGAYCQIFTYSNLQT